MSEFCTFAIQRTDGRWYAGRSYDGQALWSANPYRAEQFGTYIEAAAALGELRAAGFPVRLLGLT